MTKTYYIKRASGLIENKSFDTMAEAIDKAKIIATKITLKSTF